MKKALTVFLIVSANAFGGHPDEDPAIAKLRKEFAHSLAPSKSSLQVKKTWYCDESPASRGQNTGVKEAEYFKFKDQGELDGVENYKNTVLPHYRSFRILHMRKDALMGYGTLGLDPIEDTKYMYFVRVANDGRLLVESTKRTASIAKPENYAPAISAAGDGEFSLSVTTYSECRTERAALKKN